MVSSTIPSRIAENKHILRVIVRAVFSFARQGLALRGDVENVSSQKSPENVLVLVGCISLDGVNGQTRWLAATR